MSIFILAILGLAVLVGLGAFASYLRLLMRRLTPVAARKIFPAGPDGAIAPDRERVGVSISALHGAAMACFSIGLTTLVLRMQSGSLWASLGTILLIVLGVIAVFDQLIPFVLVARHDAPEEILLGWYPVLRRMVYLALPLTFPILISTTIRRLLEGGEPESEPAKPQEEFQEFLEVGEQEGLIEKEEGEILQSVVEFAERPVREIMTPRTEIAAIEVDASIEELRALYREKRHIRIPVYRESLDQIEGFVSMGDLMYLPPEEQARTTVASLVRPVPFVPETKKSGELLNELRRSTTQMAMVVDEYGSVSGLITLEDMVEEIVGEIRDEVEPHDRDIVRESAHNFVVAGHTDIASLAEVTGKSLAADGFSTVAGLVLAHLGHVPRPGEKMETQGLAIDVLEANARAVLKVHVRVLGASPSPEAAIKDAGHEHRRLAS